MRLDTSLSAEGLVSLLVRQLEHYFPDGREVPSSAIRSVIKDSLSRLEVCFSHIDNKYFFNGKAAIFDHLHGDQYAMWLYIISNQLHRVGAPMELSKKIFLLNKALHGCDVFYEVVLPDIFLLVHPLGTVLGRALYGDFFVAYQRCGIGANKNAYPQLGKNVTLHPGASVLGDSVLSDNCTVAADSLVLDTELRQNSLYIGNPKSHFICERPELLPIWRTL